MNVLLVFFRPASGIWDRFLVIFACFSCFCMENLEAWTGNLEAWSQKTLNPNPSGPIFGPKTSNPSPSGPIFVNFYVFFMLLREKP